MIVAFFLFVSVAIVSVVERYVKSWGFRVLLNIVILSGFGILVFNIGLYAGESSTRGIIAREVAVEFTEFRNGGDTNRSEEVNSAIQELQESVLKIVADERKEFN